MSDTKDKINEIDESVDINESGSSMEKQKRRKVLKSIVAGGGVVTAASTADKWVEPVVKSLMLPAHAQTSAVSDTDASATTMAPTTMAPTTTVANDPTGNFTSGILIIMNGSGDESKIEYAADDSISDELLEFFIPSANAQQSCDMANCSVTVNATVQESDAVFCTNSPDRSSPYYSASVSVDTTMNPATLTQSFNLGLLNIDSGSFDNANEEWVLMGTDSQNASTTIVMSRGGVGCGDE